MSFLLSSCRVLGRSILFAFLLGMTLAAGHAADQLNDQLPGVDNHPLSETSELVIEGGAGGGWGDGVVRHRFSVEIADSREERARGLMFRRHLADDAGMLFLFDRPRPVEMWMKNTFISLDMLFFDDSGKIVSLVSNTTPHSLEKIGPSVPVRGVLEVPGGTAARLDLSVADRLIHPLIQKSSGDNRGAH